MNVHCTITKQFFSITFSYIITIHLGDAILTVIISFGALLTLGRTTKIKIQKAYGLIFSLKI